MTTVSIQNRLSGFLVVAALISLGHMADVKAADAFPKIGDSAAEFELKSLAGEKVALVELNKQGPVVLVVLRGYPGYQCPVCNQQVGTYLKSADAFREAKAQVVFIYPGPSKNLVERAKEFYADKTIPGHFQLLLDPDYAFTRRYQLRWDAKNETAYPATFVIDADGKVTFAKISQMHGGRTKPEEALEALAKLK